MRLRLAHFLNAIVSSTSARSRQSGTPLVTLAAAKASNTGRTMSSSSSSTTTAASVFSKLKENPGQTFLLDGGTGEELFRLGVPDDRKIWSAKAIVDPHYHNVLQQVHQSFATAGSHAITTNSYGLVPGVGFTRDEIGTHCATAARLAREAVQGTDTIVLGSLGPLVESYRSDLIMEHDKGVLFYVSMIAAMQQHVDAFLAETMSCVAESMQVVDAMAQTSKAEAVQSPLLISYTLQSDGCLRSGEVVKEAIPRILEYASEKGVNVVAILFNCCEPESVTLALKSLPESDLNNKDKILLGAYANRLTPVPKGWTMADSDAPQPMRGDLDPQQYYTDFVSEWKQRFGIQLIGGCCGITPEHIKYIRENVQ